MPHVHQRIVRAARVSMESMAALLLFLILNIFVVPFVESPDRVVERLIRDALLSLILLSGVMAVATDRRPFLVCATVATVAVLVRWGNWIFPTPETVALNDVAGLFSLGVLCAVLGMKVFRPGRAASDRILGAIALYALIGVVWAEAYQLINLHLPGSFNGTPTGNSSNRSTWIYFSFVTLTTVGYGDITPVAKAVKSLAIFEALIGQLYPAIVLARLVSLQTAGSGSGDKA
jgi:hypothetical protein